MWQELKDSRVVGFLSLFTSFGTLLCCALPSTLVLLGFGASLAGFLSEFPQLIWLSEKKEWVFGVSFFMLGFSLFVRKSSAKKACPIEYKDDCEKAKDWSRPLWLITLMINLIGAFYAFLLPKLL
jgi:hypothetical protein